jgi:hypothetical protein
MSYKEIIFKYSIHYKTLHEAVFDWTLDESNIQKADWGVLLRDASVRKGGGRIP